MKIIQSGVINGMNFFSRKMENLIEQQIENKNLMISSYSLPEIDKSLFYMFKIYQKAQTEIADSLSIAANNQKS